MAFHALRTSLANYLAPTEIKEAPVSDATFGFDAFLTPNTVSGPAVTPQSAMCVPTVKASVELISTSLGTLPVKVFERQADGSKTVAKEHPAYRLVHRTANDYLSAGKLREIMAADALLYGNGLPTLTASMARLWKWCALIRVQFKSNPIR